MTTHAKGEQEHEWPTQTGAPQSGGLSGVAAQPGEGALDTPVLAFVQAMADQPCRTRRDGFDNCIAQRDYVRTGAGSYAWSYRQKIANGESLCETCRARDALAALRRAAPGAAPEPRAARHDPDFWIAELREQGWTDAADTFAALRATPAPTGGRSMTPDERAAYGQFVRDGFVPDGTAPTGERAGGEADALRKALREIAESQPHVRSAMLRAIACDALTRNAPEVQGYAR